MKLDILGTGVDSLIKSAVLERIGEYIHGRGNHLIVTVNPEFIMAARHDPEFRHILNTASLAVPDGFGLHFAARRQGQRIAERITGVDLMSEIAALAAREGGRVFLLGARRGIAAGAAYALMQQHPGLDVVGAESGYRRWHRHMTDEKLRAMINRKKPDILFVAFGQVKQEKWLYRNLPLLPTVRVAMGVGGSFDYMAGRVRRAPAWMRKLGLEWLFRLMRQPWRLPRVITAVVRFLWAVIRLPHT